MIFTQAHPKNLPDHNFAMNCEIVNKRSGAPKRRNPHLHRNFVSLESQSKQSLVFFLPHVAQMLVFLSALASHALQEPRSSEQTQVINLTHPVDDAFGGLERVV
jgi:hypothetical protein